MTDEERPLKKDFPGILRSKKIAAEADLFIQSGEIPNDKMNSPMKIN
jgi:hypothetical protein